MREYDYMSVIPKVFEDVILPAVLLLILYTIILPTTKLQKILSLLRHFQNSKILRQMMFNKNDYELLKYTARYILN